MQVLVEILFHGFGYFMSVTKWTVDEGNPCQKGCEAGMFFVPLIVCPCHGLSP